MSANIIKNTIRKLRQRSVDFDVEKYNTLLGRINEIDLSRETDSQLMSISYDLRQKAQNGSSLDELLILAYALVREASWRVLKLRPFDVQVIAAIAMHHGVLAEMQTGEGKTLAAVMPAYLNGLTGKGVHILTFNDYLAYRDSVWMGPVFEFLGLTTGFIREGMTVSEHQAAYSKDITYLTAREAGFDYLKGFLCLRKRDLLLRPFNYAIIDEADSILIDEARIPLVIAGRTGAEAGKVHIMSEIVKRFKLFEDYETDEFERNVYLTNAGIGKIEEIFGCGDLYSTGNVGLLVDLNNALHAEALLKRDIDYIVRNGKIELVDEFTGRVADKRHWPYGLQEAIEAKEGLKPGNRGQILASITLQNFMRLYPKISGMTGTAQPSANEFLRTYGLQVVVIPTNRPCIRIDHPDMIFTHREAKFNALVQETAKVHAVGRPVLIGTCSVEESEMLAVKLNEAGIFCQVLNAKNDELEANIVANAGAYGAVTVSTNMAGRGTDIKLGGRFEQDRDKIVELGGLYVIGTNRHESLRIDWQLRGRAGRQGDPGSSRFFISLEDDLMKRYKLKDMIPASIYPSRQDEPVAHPVIGRQIAAAQRIIQGQNADIRINLSKYSIVLEQQRQIIFNWRRSILEVDSTPGLMASRLPERYGDLLGTIGKEALEKAERQVAMYFANRCWADYLDYISYMRESLTLFSISGRTPVDDFNIIAAGAFNKMMADLENEIVQALSRVEITKDGVDLEKEGMKAPSSTWTYQVSDTKDQLASMPIPADPFSALLLVSVLLGTYITKSITKKAKHLK